MKDDFNFLHGKFDNVTGHNHDGSPGNGVKATLPSPDYDSGWVTVSQGYDLTLTHNLNYSAEKLFVFLVGKNYDVNNNAYLTNYGYGLYYAGSTYHGGNWDDLTNTNVRLHRGSNDTLWAYMKIRIWKLP
ncbi:MAG: hypothetical protein AB1472_03790 [Candidatus Omnitrophota bacterium]